MRILFCLLAAFLPILAHADSEDIFAEMLGRPERPGAKLSYQFSAWDTKGIHLTPYSVGVRRHETEFSTPISTSENNKWKLLFGSANQEIRSNARFPNGRPLPSSLWDVHAGFSYAHKIRENRSWGTNVSFGSSGDRVLAAGRDLRFRTTFIYRYADSEESAWLFFLSLANNRGFAEYVPFPGFAYAFSAARNLRLVAGLPFLMAIWTPGEKNLITFSYFPLDSAQMQISRFLFGPARVYLKVQNRTENYSLWDRANTSERLYYKEAVAEAGLTMPALRWLMLDFHTGLSFDRKYYLGEKQRSWRDGQVLRPEKSFFAALKASVRFL